MKSKKRSSKQRSKNSFGAQQVVRFVNRTSVHILFGDVIVFQNLTNGSIFTATVYNTSDHNNYIYVIFTGPVTFFHLNLDMIHVIRDGNVIWTSESQKENTFVN